MNIFMLISMDHPKASGRLGVVFYAPSKRRHSPLVQRGATWIDNFVATVAATSPQDNHPFVAVPVDYDPFAADGSPRDPVPVTRAESVTLLQYALGRSALAAQPAGE